MRPNIFEIATKELSQDAFITWLLKFADHSCRQEDMGLSNCGKDFITKLIKKQFTEFNEPIVSVDAGRQWEGIDIWATVNEKYLIIIEDKTSTSHHSNQLKRYKIIAEKWCLSENYNNPICIYLKTGNESQNSLKQIEKQGFSIFNRIDFLEILNQHELLISNNIFVDFRGRLLQIEKSTNDYNHKPIKDWRGSEWQGFFQFIEKEINIVNWHYVNNPNGGFWNLVLNWDYWDIYPVYLQIEEGKMCFKVSTHPDDAVVLPEGETRSNIRNKLSHLIIDSSKTHGYLEISRPGRFGNGRYMTLAIIDSKNWLANDDELIDKENVLAKITLYLDFLRNTIKQN